MRRKIPPPFGVGMTNEKRTNHKTGPSWCVVPGAPKVVNIEEVFPANSQVLSFRRRMAEESSSDKASFTETAMNNFLRDAVSLW